MKAVEELNQIKYIKEFKTYYLHLPRFIEIPKSLWEDAIKEITTKLVLITLVQWKNC
jgi:hypothetical protein